MAQGMQEKAAQESLGGEPGQQIDAEDELDGKVDDAKGEDDADHFAQDFEENPKGNAEDGNGGAAHGAPIAGDDGIPELFPDGGLSCGSGSLSKRKDLSEKFFKHNAERTLA